MATVSEFEIGATLGTLTNVEELDPPLCPPRATIPGLSQRIEAADGYTKAVGWVTCVWTWDWLDQAMYNVLRTYSTASSTKLVIKTKVEDGTYDTFDVIMVWPSSPVRLQNVFRDIDIVYRMMTPTT